MSSGLELRAKEREGKLKRGETNEHVYGLVLFMGPLITLLAGRTV